MRRLDQFGYWRWDGDWISHGIGGLLGFHGSTVAGAGWSQIDEGAAATVDGIIPFYNPLEGYYADPCGNVAEIYQTSRNIAAISRDIGVAAAFPGMANIRAWASNPIRYELGQTSVSNAIWATNNMASMTVAQRAAWIRANGGFVGNVNWLQMIRNTPTGPTPGAWFTLAGASALDHLPMGTPTSSRPARGSDNREVICTQTQNTRNRACHDTY